MMSAALTQIKDAAVLVPLVESPDRGTRVVVILRSDHGIHGSQLAFPGGRHEPEDTDMLDTALRETEEEIGLGRDRVEVIRSLPCLVTLTTNYRIHPFLGRVLDPQPVWQPDPREVADVLEVPLDDLRRPERRGLAHHDYPGMPPGLKLPYFRVGKHRLWGATYRILEPLLNDL